MLKNRHSCRIFLPTIFLLLFIIGCRENGGVAKGIGDTKYNTYENFKKKVGGFPYTAPETKINHLVNSYPNLSLGMSKRQVFDVLGEPDIEEKLFLKYKKPGFLGWCWTYYSYKSDFWGQNLKYDQEINIFYNSNGKADWIVPHNIDKLKELKKLNN